MTRVSARSLKLAGALGTVMVCGAAGVAVAADTKPAAAPLRPPVDPAAAPAVAAAATGDALVIPPSSACTAARPAGPAPTPDPTIATAVAQIRAATTRQQRQSILMQLPADQRIQVTAYLQLLTRAGAAGSCSAPRSGGTSTSSAPVIVPSVVTGGPDAIPAVVSAVS